VKVCSNDFLIFCEYLFYFNLSTSGPSFVLAILPTNNGFTAIQVESRWRKIQKELNELGIEVIGFSTDGAANLMAGMKFLIDFGTIFRHNEMEFVADIDGTFGCIQDVVHLLNKLKMQLFDDSYNFWIGKHIASGKQIFMLVENEEFSKLDHRLVFSDVIHRDLTKDKMDFTPTCKICEWRVINILETLPGTEGTVEYLKVMRYLIEAFIEKNTTVHDRIRKAFYALHFFRKWQHDLDVKKIKSTGNFISKNCFDSVEICVSFLARLAKMGKAHLIHYCNSQVCERFFRNLRSLSTSGLTEINFSLYDCIKKIEKIQTMEILQSNLSKEGFRFPEKKISSSDSSSSLDSIIDTEFIIGEEEKWSNDMLSIVYDEMRDEVNCFADLANMYDGILNLSRFFTYPNRELILKNQMKKYTLRNYQIEPIELEEIFYEDGNLIGQYVIIKNKRFLNEEAGKLFKIKLEYLVTKLTFF
jgi:hypothetical protein